MRMMFENVYDEGWWSRMCTTSGGGARRQRWAAGPGSASRVKPVEPAAALQSEIDCRAEHIGLNLKTVKQPGGQLLGWEGK